MSFMGILGNRSPYQIQPSGILDTAMDPGLALGIAGSGAAQVQPQNAGLLNNAVDPFQALANNPMPKGIGPGKWDQGGSGWQDVSAVGAGLRDIGAQLEGRPQFATNMDEELAKRQEQDRRQLQAQALGEMATAKTGQDFRSAAFHGAAAGIDPSAIGQISKFGLPTYSNAPLGDTVFATDPISGERTVVQQGQRPPQNPQVSNGMQRDPLTGKWSPIPGYVDVQRDIAGARRKPAAAATGLKPWQMFGGQ